MLTSFSEVRLVLLKVILLKPDIGFTFVFMPWANFGENEEKKFCKRKCTHKATQ
jgi:hypothetical protein